ncbi:MCP four helix bundle domain-containing protein [Massilia genomosp. 1]|uniref:Chemotaxis methyl-accepting receptor HlyB-like 4HB MCP domain-containing protein n=1 Tax=Massilia genomosp. 1 TaxID=2609280 RepID=A0ABX0MPY4_9BURK|nr:MCP four helix bundle domain-containing protein [Massilia genomosp. 1]NHZ62436.1 hypothetical protein [Massilia genomosp. 1]
MLDNMKVGTRLLGAVVIVVLLGSIVAAIGILNMATMNDQAELAYDRELLGLSYTKQANIDLVGIGRTARQHAAGQLARASAPGRGPPRTIAPPVA